MQLLKSITPLLSIYKNKNEMSTTYTLKQIAYLKYIVSPKLSVIHMTGYLHVRTTHKQVVNYSGVMVATFVIILLCLTLSLL